MNLVLKVGACTVRGGQYSRSYAAYRYGYNINYSSSYYIGFRVQLYINNKITLDKSNFTMIEGENTKLTATIIPNSANNNPKIEWSSTDTNIADVDNTGLVIAKKEGTVTIIAKTTDGSNRQDECNITVKKLPKTVNELKEGEYVYYEDANGDKWKCAVLYDSDSMYGVEITTLDVVGDYITFGDHENNTLEHLRLGGYNDAITTLNSSANGFNNSTYSTQARSIGSVPDNINLEGDTFYFSTEIKDEDENYLIDWEQMKKLRIHIINKSYWLTSRAVNRDVVDNDRADIYLRDATNNGSVRTNLIANGWLDRWSSSTGYFWNNRDHSSRLRPVFKLKETIKITGGKGSEDEPYTLGE